MDDSTPRTTDDNTINILPAKETEELKKKIRTAPDVININPEEVHVDNKVVVLEAPLTNTNTDTVMPNKNSNKVDIDMDMSMNMNMNSAVAANTSIEPIEGEQRRHIETAAAAATVVATATATATTSTSTATANNSMATNDDYTYDNDNDNNNNNNSAVESIIRHGTGTTTTPLLLTSPSSTGASATISRRRGRPPKLLSTEETVFNNETNATPVMTNLPTPTPTSYNDNLRCRKSSKSSGNNSSHYNKTSIFKKFFFLINVLISIPSLLFMGSVLSAFQNTVIEAELITTQPEKNLSSTSKPLTTYKKQLRDYSSRINGLSAIQAMELEISALLRIEKYCDGNLHFPKLVTSDNQSITTTTVGTPFSDYNKTMKKQFLSSFSLDSALTQLTEILDCLRVSNIRHVDLVPLLNYGGEFKHKHVAISYPSVSQNQNDPMTPIIALSDFESSVIDNNPLSAKLKRRMDKKTTTQDYEDDVRSKLLACFGFCTSYDSCQQLIPIPNQKKNETKTTETATTNNNVLVPSLPSPPDTGVDPSIVE